MNKRRLKRFARAALVSIFIAMFVCEIGLRIAVAHAPNMQPDLTMTRLRSSGTMPQYAHSPYWSVDFAKTLDQFFDAHMRIMNDDMQWATKDTHMLGYTIINDERLTTDQPAYFERDVWLYGSSTVWGAYVADGWTISSYLQREFNRRGIPWRVHNMGQGGINITLEYYWLTKTNVHSGDIIIFIDGAVDLKNTLEESAKEWADSILPCRVAQNISVLLLNLWCEMVTWKDSPWNAPIEFVTSRMQINFARYWNIVQNARDYAQKHEAKFWHFMQPTANLPYPELYEHLRSGDPLLVIAPEDYFDFLHYDDDGHEKIARQIADIIALTF